MKTVLASFTILSIFLLVACKKDMETPAIKPQIEGTYIGAYESRSADLEEVFTSPTMSHFEWVYDSVFQNPDTLTIAEISPDSFSLQGNVAAKIPAYWHRFAWNESADSNGTFTYNRGLLSTGYSEQLQLVFGPDKSVKASYARSIANSNSSLSFNGGK